jgi:adenylate cyclase class IV
MQNVELKVRCADLTAVRERARELGATEEGLLLQTDTYFVAGTGRLKLREVEGWGASLIAYERPDAAGTRVSDYEVVPVDQPEGLKRALARALGVRIVVRKQREFWLYRYTRIHLDTVEGLGEFVELETVAQGISLAAAQAECEAVAARLDIAALPRLPGSYSDLLF